MKSPASEMVDDVIEQLHLAIGWLAEAHISPRESDVQQYIREAFACIGESEKKLGIANSMLTRKQAA